MPEYNLVVNLNNAMIKKILEHKKMYYYGHAYLGLGFGRAHLHLRALIQISGCKHPRWWRFVSQTLGIVTNQWVTSQRLGTWL